MKDDAALVEEARNVLRANYGKEWTKPHVDQYPHQWNWDSGFISLGWATFDWQRSALEIQSMLAARWNEGMVPQIHYDKDRLEDYFPGPDRWPRAKFHVKRKGELTSGISNPPVLAMSALRIGQRQPKESIRHAFWRSVLGDLTDWLEYFAVQRHLPGSPLIGMVHPWESGCDNSPRWDHLKQAKLKPREKYIRKDKQHVPATDRPTDRDYDAYIALAEMLDDCDYDLAGYRRITPFCMYDVLVDSLWYAAARDVNQMAEELGERAPFDRERLAEFHAQFERLHWDDKLGLYVDWDCVAGEQRSLAAGPCLVALATGFVDRDRAAAVWRRYRALQGEARSICTVPPSITELFHPTNYWRGPVWLNINWLVIEGLYRCGLADQAGELRGETLDLVRQAGFAEYYNPLTGEPAGIRHGFSWSAALTLDLLESFPQ